MSRNREQQRDNTRTLARQMGVSGREERRRWPEADMRVALFHDGAPRLPRLRGELEARGHRVFVVGPGASQRFLAHLFEDERPDIIHGLGRGPVSLVLATAWGLKLRGRGTSRVADVAGVAFVDGLVDGSLPGAPVEWAYLEVLGLR